MSSLSKYLFYAFFIGIICVIGFGIVALFISDHKINQFDSSVILAVQGQESPMLTSIMKFFTFIGSTPIVVILSLLIMVFLYKVLHHRQELIIFFAAIAGSAILNEILKNMFHRVRPNLHRLIPIEGYSFPSGHAMSAFAVYGILAFLLWRHINSRLGRSLLIAFSVIMILAIGISRIYLGVHYPSDVLGGYLASGFWLAILIWFFQYFKEKRYNKTGQV